MNLKELQRNWELFARTDPLWSILTWNNKKNGKWDIGDFLNTGKSEIKFILDNISSSNLKLNYKTALDFGCGVGRLSQALAEKFEKVYGIDISPTMIELANKYNQFGDCCIYLINEKEDIRIFSDNYFDFIYSFIVLQHIKPKYTLNYIAEFIRIIKPGGVIIFQLPSEPLVDNKQKISYFRRVKNIFQNKSNFPIMEMHGIKKEVIQKFTEEKKGKLIKIIEDYSAPGWKSYKYIITK